MNFVWFTSTNNSSWTGMMTPDKYKIDWEDLDKDSYRSAMTGDLYRNVIRRRWAKVGMTFKDLSEDECSAILEAVNQDTVYFRFLSPAFKTSGYISFEGSVSKMSVEVDDLVEKGWTVSFNVVQAKGANWQ